MYYASSDKAFRRQYLNGDNVGLDALMKNTTIR